MKKLFQYKNTAISCVLILLSTIDFVGAQKPTQDLSQIITSRKGNIKEAQAAYKAIEQATLKQTSQDDSTNAPKEGILHRCWCYHQQPTTPLYCCLNNLSNNV